MSNWKKLHIGKAIKFNPPESILKGTVAKKIPMGSLTAFKRKINSFELSVFNSGPKFRNGDTLVAKITPCIENGKTAFVDILDENEVAFGSSEFIVLRETEHTVPEYIYYLAISPTFRKRAISCMEGTSGRKRVSEKTLKFFELDFPPIHAQKRIGKVLSYLDAKIELNIKINAELEAMAKLIYDYWFVQFDFLDENGKPYKSSGGKMVYNEELKREIPEGWEVKKLSDVSSFISRGISPKYIDDGGTCVINQKCVRRGTVLFEQTRRNNESLRNSSKKRIALHDVLVNSTGVGTLGRVSIVRRLPEETITVDSHVTIVRSNQELMNKFYFGYTLLQKQKEIERFSLGSTGQVELSRFQLESILTIKPSNYLQLKFEKTYKPICEKQANNERENQNLVNLRDWLLPMLMNGQVKVN